ncbi:hypothetical protein [Rickettsiella endosymbiont of Aleochara curtula]|uniref:hypothetical protein n=1 Tax=Rickettsiella endosymbiont of Aleochara curtula TaxID=3077936 RepID=UPI00313DC5E4
MKKSYDLPKAFKANIPSELKGSYTKIEEFRFLKNSDRLTNGVCLAYIGFPFFKTPTHSVSTLSNILSQISGHDQGLNPLLNSIPIQAKKSENTSNISNLSLKSTEKEKWNGFVKLSAKFFSFNRKKFTNGVTNCSDEFIFLSGNKL